MSANLYFAILLIFVAVFFFFILPVNISPLDYLNVMFGKERIMCNSTDNYYCYYANTTQKVDMPMSLYESVKKCAYEPSSLCNIYTVFMVIFLIIGLVGFVVLVKEIIKR